MDDKELLTLAAKAAGIRQVWVETSLISEWVLLDSDNKEIFSWNPLTDDGDALRLAVKLLIELNHNHFQQTVDAYYSPDFSQKTIKLTEDYGNDPYAATRRAVTRAAAEIGKEKNKEKQNDKT